MASIRFSFFVLACVLHVFAATAADDLKESLPHFQPVTTEPVFTGVPGQWDAKIRERGWIMKDGDLWRMWYTGYDPNQQPPLMKLGYATSKDGLSWTRSSLNPLIGDFWVEDMMVVKKDDRYYMFAEGLNDQSQLLESADGVHWTRIGTLDVRLTNGEPIPPGPFGTPTAFFENGTWNLFYERRDAGIWLARSKDMKVWTNVSDAPVIVPGPDMYDQLMIAMNQVIKVDGKYIAILHGTGTQERPRQWCTTVAESTDLIHWTKSSLNPLRPIAENKSSGLLIQDGQRWRLYTMHDKVEVHLAP